MGGNGLDIPFNVIFNIGVFNFHSKNLLYEKIIVSISFILTAILCNTSCSDYLDIVPEGTPGHGNSLQQQDKCP